MFFFQSFSQTAPPPLPLKKVMDPPLTCWMDSWAHLGFSRGGGGGGVSKNFQTFVDLFLGRPNCFSELS